MLKKLIALQLSILLFVPSFSYAKDSRRSMSDDQLIEMLDLSLKALPEKIAKIDPRVRRIAFYSLKVDRTNITLPLFRQIYGKIEAAFLKLERPLLIYAPEIKPLKVISNENTISFISGFQSTQEIRDISTKLKLDGYLEGELYITDRTLYLNLRIFESENMSIVWSEELTSITPPPLPVQKMTGVDYGVGLDGIPVSGTSSSTGLELPSYAQYYSVDLRISQKTITGEKARFTLTGGLLSKYEGLFGPGIDSTIVSDKSKGGSGIYFFTRVGMRISLIPAKTIDIKRDWLSADITIGRLFGLGTSGVTTFGVRLESDITRNITMGAGVQYIPLTDVSVNSAQTVKAGGLAYEISLLRLNFKP